MTKSNCLSLYKGALLFACGMVCGGYLIYKITECPSVCLSMPLVFVTGVLVLIPVAMVIGGIYLIRVK